MYFKFDTHYTQVLNMTWYTNIEKRGEAKLVSGAKILHFLLTIF
jgi:hypothetical protein